ncbi:dolichyl-phosphate-mannose-protein mannosyltransferase [Halanaerobium sp. DL-01]|uniref:ArnT family glycosyltransferase n=1 Tax=Halanaerobium sp. DL-01 TaxID=1653064 RepID=UPI000DF3AC9D|nr:glycosyltransferase family 39 protein [Halanaerobium sp. DL-01]RCW83286.1 dolichyl-phosphate-mannose-protein mannosyltransferase [Halanaerobium sp. DL-01]
MIKIRKNYVPAVILLALLIFFVYFFNIGNYDLWSPDEPRYAEVARETAVEGNWVIPHLNNRVYYEKPPVFYNIIALTGLINGEFSAAAVRFPVIITAVLLIAFFTYYTITKIDFYTGLLSGIILATTGQFFWLAMRVNLDIPLVFCTTISALIFFHHIDSFYSYKWRTLIAFFLMGLGAVIKSPISLLPLLVVIIYAFLNKKTKKLKEIPWISAFVVMLIPAAVWLYLAYNKAGFSYIQITVLDQLIGYSTGSQGHPQPFYYYLLNFPVLALPWSIFLIPAIYYYNKFKIKVPNLVRFSMLWFVMVFIIFSLVGSKRGVYLLQLYPAFSIIIAWFFKLHFDGTIRKKYSLVIPVLILGILFAVLGGYIFFNGEMLIQEELDFNLNENPDYYNLYQGLYLFFTVTGILFFLSAAVRNKRFVFYITVLFSLVLIILLKSLFLPAVNEVKSERYLAEDLAEAYNKNVEVGLWGSLNNDSGFVFYNGIYYDYIFDDPESGKEFLERPGKQILIVNEADKLLNNLSENEYRDFEIKKYRVGSDDMLLLIEKELMEGLN